VLSGHGVNTLSPDHRFTASTVRGCGSFYEPAILELDLTELLLANLHLCVGWYECQVYWNTVCYLNIHVLCIAYSVHWYSTSWNPNYVCTIYRVCVSKLISNIRSHTGYGVSYWISNIGYVEYWASKPNIGYPISDLSNIEFLNPILDIQCRVSKPDIGYPTSDIGYWIFPISDVGYSRYVCVHALYVCIHTHSITLRCVLCLHT
jgi:hypothetical protein